MLRLSGNERRQDSRITWLGAALLILCYYRSLSRNISKRTEENYRFYSLCSLARSRLG